MAGVPDQPGRSGPGWNEPEYEVIGGGMIDDQRIGADPQRTGSAPSPAVFTAAVQEAWQSARGSFTTWWFWLACAVGIALSWGMAAAVVGWGEANGWFETPVTSSTYLIMAAFLALMAAVLGVIWGFRNIQGSFLGLLLAGAMRGVALSAPAFAVLLAIAISVGGPIGLAAAAVVVMVLEVALFGLMGAGSRACFTKGAPGAALAAALTVFFCVLNVVVTVLLLPGTSGTDQASVPVNVERDDTGRITSYECIGSLHPVEVAHTDRVAWLAASNPALLLGSVGAGFVPTDNEVGWVLAGLQWAADGPARDVPCLGGESSEGLAPSMPVALTGFAAQTATAALLAVAGRRLAARRLRTS
ncbi:hypothetical protein SAMN04487912_107236 [Arthrobacter sp. cf158]|uniref:hypothetical protein n=1 Tax=Arthrobacter sp. cf158 TaxID=1761744 RepID=UPI00089D29C3|nr:hypothetical protein [Arthrobacter sp. cf158]SDX13312.1 hypothetical protein SAMN04487912_107236 [Arthrobacter sp. cf158]